MKSVTALFVRGTLIASAISLLTGTLVAPAVSGEIVLTTNLDYRGPVHRVAFESSGQVAWLATPRVLYEVRDKKAQEVDTGPSGEAKLHLAPGGSVYAWLVGGDAPNGLFTVELGTLPPNPLAKLRLKDFPFGFTALYLGERGRLIATATPLNDPEGLEGKFLYVFWSSDGKRLHDITLEGYHVGVVDATGTALVLLGKAEAIAFSAIGKQLWRHTGSYRKAAIAKDGNVALLNPAQKNGIQEVHARSGNQVATLKMPSAVHHLALSDDGSKGAIAIDQGRLFLLAPQTGKVKEVPFLPADKTFFVTALRFLDDNTLAVGAIQRTGNAPRFDYPNIAVVALNASDGKVLFQSKFPLEQPTTYTPSIDVTYGVRRFAAHTPHKTFLIEIDP